MLCPAGAVGASSSAQRAVICWSLSSTVEHADNRSVAVRKREPAPKPETVTARGERLKHELDDFLAVIDDILDNNSGTVQGFAADEDE